ncbi:hypothetical protein BC941DRAFT_341335, partial [Chlamydoabsidia padenii]
WMNYSPARYRQQYWNKMSSSLIPSSLTPRAKWTTFWRQQMHPQGRTLWYRLTKRKLYCQLALSKIRPLTTLTCLLCQNHEETLDHLFVQCSQKWPVWIKAFDEIIPSITNIIFEHQVPSISGISSSIWILYSCIIQIIWKHHWAYVIHQNPF